MCHITLYVKPIDNYCLTQQLLLALQSISVSFSSLFWLTGPQLTTLANGEHNWAFRTHQAGRNTTPNEC